MKLPYFCDGNLTSFARVGSNKRFSFPPLILSPFFRADISVFYSPLHGFTSSGQIRRKSNTFLIYSSSQKGKCLFAPAFLCWSKEFQCLGPQSNVRLH